MQILKILAVCKKTGFAKPTIFLKVRKGEFPKPIKLGARATGWLESDIDDWISERVAASRQA